ncbi:unnamed protein product, partial [Sphacelaria rigidula]
MEDDSTVDLVEGSGAVASASNHLKANEGIASGTGQIMVAALGNELQERKTSALSGGENALAAVAPPTDSMEGAASGDCRGNSDGGHRNEDVRTVSSYSCGMVLEG